MLDSKGVVSSQRVIDENYRVLEIRSPEIVAAAQPGQFVHLRLPGLEASALRRPFSIYGAEEGTLRILYKTVGRGTRSMNALQAGDAVQVLGPIGRGFPLPSADVTPLLVAGGYGVAPLVFLAKKIGRPGFVLIGGRTASDLLLQEDFLEMGWTVLTATQDGSAGVKGLVTQPFDTLVQDLLAAGKTVEAYCCGPDGLLRAMGDRAIAGNFRGWLSLDKHMVCGVGACLACVQKLRGADGAERLGRVCVDGPVFESREIVWG